MTKNLPILRNLMLQLRNLTLVCDHKTICENLSLDIEKGNSLILRGPNGSGKTAFIECLIGDRTPLSGQVLLDQHDIHHLERAEKKLFTSSTGIVRQQSRLRSLDTLERALSSPKNTNDDIGEMLIFLGLEPRSNSLVKHLSWGEVRKLDLVRSLSNDPSLLIWDEPFIGLDKVTQEKFQSVLMKLKSKGSTIIIATINLETFSFLNPEKVLEL